MGGVLAQGSLQGGAGIAGDAVDQRCSHPGSAAVSGPFRPPRADRPHEGLLETRHIPTPELRGYRSNNERVGKR